MRTPPLTRSVGTKVSLWRLQRRRNVVDTVFAVWGQRIPLEDGALAIFAPVIATESAISTQHVVARNQPSDRIRADCVADGTRTALLTDRGGETRIRRAAVRSHIEQRLPDLELEVGSRDMEAQRLARRCRGTPDAIRKIACSTIVARDGGAPPALAELADGALTFARLHEREMTKPTRRSCEQRFAERRVGEAVADGDSASEILQLTGRHRIECDDEIVQPTRAGKSHGIGGIQHGGLAGNRTAGLTACHESEILLRCDARPTSEQAIEVKFRQAGLGGDGGEARLLAEMPLNEADRLGDTGEIAAVDEAVMRSFHAAHHSDGGGGSDPVLAVDGAAGRKARR